MKKKYRRAVYFILIGIPYIIMGIGWAMEKLASALCDYPDWLKTKLRIYDD